MSRPSILITNDL